MRISNKIKAFGIFTVLKNPGYTTQELREYVAFGNEILELEGVELVHAKSNLLMDNRKLIMANAIYPLIDRLVITNQIDAPQGNETGYSGVLYTSVPGDEFGRSAAENPYTIQWNISSSAANGLWGSFVGIDANGSMINRALTGGISKTIGSNIIVEFTGSVV